MNVDDVVTQLTRTTSELDRPSYFSELLAKITANRSVQGPVDLYRYSIEGATQIPKPEFIAAELLGTGAAAVIDLSDSDKALPYVVAASFKGRGGEWREYCDPIGNYVLKVTDVIVD